MIAYLLAAVGGYLIGNSLKAKQYADGGETETISAAKSGEINESQFDRLKKGDKIKITYSDSISGNSEKDLMVKSKTLVGKGKSWESEKITFVNIDNPNGINFFAYKRKNGNITFAIGDMAIWNVKIK